MKKRKKSRSDAPIPFMLCMRGAILACIGTVIFDVSPSIPAEMGVIANGQHSRVQYCH